MWNDTVRHEGDGATELAQMHRYESAWQPVIWLMHLFKQHCQNIRNEGTCKTRTNVSEIFMVHGIKPLPSVSLKVKHVIYVPLMAPNRPAKITVKKFQTLAIGQVILFQTRPSQSLKRTVCSSVWCH